MKYALPSALLAALLATACQSVDPSAPSRPRTSLLPADSKAQENAEKRTLEAPKQQIPTAGQEFPGQSNATPSPNANPLLPSIPTVLTLSDAPTSKPSCLDCLCQWFDHLAHPHPAPVVRDRYPGPVPSLPANPGKTPMAGSTPVPGTDWALDNSWGQGMQLENYHHRPWADTTADYKAAEVKNNPFYRFDIRPLLPVQQNDGTYKGDMKSTAYEVPWFILNTAAMPALMVLQPPLAQTSSNQLGHDPMYHGYLPATGDIVPTPAPPAKPTTIPAFTTTNPANSPETAPATP